MCSSGNYMMKYSEEILLVKLEIVCSLLNTFNNLWGLTQQT